MFTDQLNLPIDKERAKLQDQVLSLTGMTWDDYEKITQLASNYRASYFDGVITIVSPSLNHERIAEVINGLVKAYCRKYNLLYFPWGSTTLRNPFTAGKEPDHSFTFEIQKDIPDLAIEVVFSSGSIQDLQKYQYLGVNEVWLWQNESIKFYQLIDTQYVEITVSSCLPNLSSVFLIEFINRGLTESPLTIEDDFIKHLN
ncbi:MAG: Uma2 family endonuclease [Cyanobacteria bacterium P01_G01_bin.67]